MQRTIIYARVSTEDQLEKYGLPAQFRACREYAASHGLDVIEEITDDGISGEILERPGLDRLRELVRAKAIDAILMLDPDRLSRVVCHAAMLKRDFDKAGCELKFVTGSFESTPAGNLFFNVKASFSEYEREVIRDRTMRGKRERAKAGLIVGGRVCYGYQYEGGKLIPDPERAETARNVFAWYAAGESIRAIAMKLRAEGAPTHGGGQWGHSSVRRMLGNETYAGIARYLRSKRADKGPRLIRPEADVITISVPALVDRPVWERVQARLAASRAEHPGGRPSAAYLLQGLIRCTCGRRMGGERSKGSHSYRCFGRDPFRAGERCKRTVSAPKLDSAVWKQLSALVSDARELRRLIAERQEKLKQSDPAQLAKLEEQARKLKRREDQALSLMLDPDFAADRMTVKRQYQDAQRERTRIEGEIAAARRAMGRSLETDWITETVALLREDLREMTSPEQKQAFVRLLVAGAEWNGEVLKMKLFVGAKTGTMSAWSAHLPESAEFVLNVRLAA